MVLTTGCTGRTIKVDNPVFDNAPPRKSLVNSASSDRGVGMASLSDEGVQPVGFSPTSTAPMSATTIVALVNSRPVFLDDVAGDYRKLLESKSELTTDQRNYLLRQHLEKQLPDYVRQEVVVQTLRQKVPADRQKMITDSLEPMFQQITENIKAERELNSDQEFAELLASQGMTVARLRDQFVRVQMVNGYIATLANPPKSVDRTDMVKYYREHIDDYTTEEQVRVAEIIVRFDSHGGQTGASEVMQSVLKQLESGRSFGDVAEAFSDALSSEKKGDIGWIQQGSFADKELEQMLFQLPEGRMTRVLTREDRLELFYITSHRSRTTVAFEDLQKEIEKAILKEKAEAAKDRVIDDLMAKATVETMFDEGFRGHTQF
ncbi:MAG: peptidylprolyl isomerase [Planctomycetaceae bacterium]|nr:peptidylprolyl isomerase [Planctomycetaceae bacterium]